MKPTILIALLAVTVPACQRARPPAIAETIQTGSAQPAIALGMPRAAAKSLTAKDGARWSTRSSPCGRRTCARKQFESK